MLASESWIKTSWIKTFYELCTYAFFNNYFICFFQGPDWQYRTELPAWAKENWVDPDSL